jgi:hypothetical protein
MCSMPCVLIPEVTMSFFSRVSLVICTEIMVFSYSIHDTFLIKFNSLAVLPYVALAHFEGYQLNMNAFKL